MQLIYRGTTYDYNSLRAANRSVQSETFAPYTLRYRSTTYHVTPQSRTVEQPVQTITRRLIYRGATYWVTRTVAVANPAAATSAMTLQTV